MDEHNEEEGHIQSGWVQNVVFVFCGIGLNVCFAIYLSYIRVYGTLDPSMLGYMMISIYAAALGIVLFMGACDKYGPSVFSPKMRYGIFISFSLVMMTVTLSLMPFLHSTNSIIVFGVMIGLFEGSGLTFSQELAAAYSGDTTKYVNTGHTIAQLFPVVMSYAVGMYQEGSTERKSEIYFALIPAGVCAVAFSLYLGVVLTGGFDAAFKGIERQSGSSKEPTEGTPLLEDGSGGTGETPKEDGDVRWFEGSLGTCVCVMILTWGMSAGFSPLTQVVGTLAYSHILMLVRFIAEFLGRLLSHLWGVTYFAWGSTALLVYTSVRVFLMIGLICQAFLLNFDERGNTIAFGAQVFIFYLLGSYVHSETMATAVDSRPKHAQKVAYAMMLLCFGAQLVALAGVVPLLKGLDVA